LFASALGNRIARGVAGFAGLPGKRLGKAFYGWMLEESRQANDSPQLLLQRQNDPRGNQRAPANLEEVPL